MNQEDLHAQLEYYKSLYKREMKKSKEFKEIVERGAAFFFKYARQGGMKLA